VTTDVLELQTVDTVPIDIEAYRRAVGDEVIASLHSLVGSLRGARVVHINATSYGGGVAELLRTIVPLYRELDIHADWLVVPGTQEFFEVTKGMHNALQGSNDALTEDDFDLYLRHSHRMAAMLKLDYDYVIVHDPQPAALRALHGRGKARWVWRCHIDTSNPNKDVLRFLMPFITDYDALVFTMEQFVPAELRNQRIVIIPPGIDPVSPKNLHLPDDISRAIVGWTGVRLDRPIMTQVSRFDPWKDPLGVIEVYREIRHRVPGTQLALLGQIALDDPEGWAIQAQVKAAAAGDADVHIMTNYNGVGNLEVNAFQRCSDVILQKSLREGFGLVVSEALWKSTPVVAGCVGGIPMQMPDGIGGFLIDDIPACIEKTEFLLKNKEEAKRLGASGRAHVEEHYLITRLLADEMKLLASLAA
jgi:trehalose synthase